MPGLSFAFGGDTGETPESLRRKREIARLMLRQGGSGRARNLGEGLASFGQSIGGGLTNLFAGQREREIESDSRRRVTQALSAIGGVPAFENPDAPSEILVPAVPGDTNKGIGILSGAIDPDIRNIAFQLQQRQADAEAERNKPFNLSPGQQRFGAPDASGERPVVASVPPTPEKPSALDRKTEALIAVGTPPDLAQKIAAGGIRISRDPVTQEVSVVDLTTNQLVPLGVAQAAGVDLTAAETAPQAGPAAQPATQSAIPPAPASPAETLFESAEQAVGIVPTVADAASGLFGQISPKFTTPEMTQARQRFNVAQNEFIRSMSINPRFPVAEQERIKREIAIDIGPTSSAPQAKQKLRSIDRSLRERLMNEQRAVQDRTLPVQTRRAAAQAAKDIENFLNTIGVPQIPSMSLEDLQGMDRSNMTERELQDAARRFEELTRGQ